jgi:hypothetical protein
MAKTPFNIQDQYLNQARKERVKLNISVFWWKVVAIFCCTSTLFLP